MVLPILLATTLTLAQKDDPHQKDIQHDIDLGNQYAKQVEKESKFTENAEYIRRVTTIGKSLAEVANNTNLTVKWGDSRHSSFPYEFKVIKGDDVNAFSLPGGKIYVYEGLLKFVESDDELAGVLSHEIGHAAERHVATLQRDEGKIEAITLPLILIAIFTQGGVNAGPAFQLSSLLGTAIGNGWSQKAEAAADDAGFQIISKSAYNPAGMVTFMERLAGEERDNPKINWGIFRTHPPSTLRLDSLMGDMKKAQLPLERSKVTTTFRTTAVPVADGVQLLLGKTPIIKLHGEDAAARAAKAVPALNKCFDQVPELFEISSVGNSFVWGSTTLFEITDEDAKGENMALSDLKAKTLKSLRAALFGISFRIRQLH
ncbi:MAG: M48 family metalloprotease [Armatimonadetes bacterium]|nr:M48 family metalloprotease [Armatimonadota bacterium]